ncbi:hypothetical protein ACJEC8_01000 [Candidatus Carsonella ruddii]|uniref:uL13 family ribosomal protein n=1 Tax=Carsonella ruddii TaxID=114186 RepID=UPI003D58992F
MIIINCKNKILGRLSSVISKIMLNFFFFKKKIFFLLFNIDYIIIKKKNYYKHSGYLGKLKNIKNNNINLFKKSIYNMFPKNKKRLFLIKNIFFFENNI